MTSQRFVGRAAELEELRTALGEAVGGRPGLSFVAGESGVGKTRLLAELERVARADGVRVIGGDCVELGEGELPYAPIVGALRPLARAGDPAFTRLSQPARAALAHILPGLGRGPEQLGDEATAQARLFDALLELLELLAGEDGLLLTVEDLHWADRSTRAFLVYLAASLCRERVLVVTTYRPDELHRRHPLRPLLAELERDARALRVELRPLTRAELAEQLCDILGEPPADELLDRLFMRSEGNPLFAEELLAAGTDGRGSLPPTLRDALMLRIERLSTDAQELLRLLAAGRRLDHEILATASGVDPRAPIREAVAAQLVVADDDGFYAFRHALLREVVADDLLPGERAAAAPRARPRAGGAGRRPPRARRRAPRRRDRPPLPGVRRPAGGARRLGARRAGRRGRARQRRGRGAVLARAAALGSRRGRRASWRGCDHVELLRAAASTHGPRARPRPRRVATCAPRWPSSATATRCAAPACSSTSPASSSTRAARPTPRRRAAARWTLLPEGPSATRAMLLAERGQGADARIAPRRGGRRRRGGARGRPRRRRRGRRAARAGRAWACALFGLGRYEEGERGAARGARADARARARPHRYRT